MRKFFVLTLSIIIALLCLNEVAAKRVFAADLTVSCADQGPCSISGSQPFFQITNWAPGASASRSFEVINQDPDDNCGLVLNASNISDPYALAPIIFTVIKDGGIDLFGIRDGLTKASSDKNLKNLFDSAGISLGTVTASGSKFFDWLVTFASEADNQYQGRTLGFDFSLAFSCGTPSAPTAAGVSVGGASAPICDSVAPGSVTNLTAAGTGTGQVLLFWSPPSTGTVTHYLIAYGTASGSYIYGNPDVGNVTSYTVSGLSSGVGYYFAIKAVNNCAPGPYSNEATAIAGGAVGAFVAAGPAAGFGILGVTTPEGQIAGAGATEAGEIAGAEVGKPICYWWLLSIVSFFMSLFYYAWFSQKEKQKRKKYQYFLPLIFGALSFAVDQFIAHLFFAPSKWCHYMWLWSSLSVLTPFLIFTFWLDKEKT